jgi:hypothetical protein
VPSDPASPIANPTTRSLSRAAWRTLAAVALAGLPLACSPASTTEGRATVGAARTNAASVPAAAAPTGPGGLVDPGFVGDLEPVRDGVWYTAEPTVIDTEAMPQIDPTKRPNERMRNKWFVPPHESPKDEIVDMGDEMGPLPDVIDAGGTSERVIAKPSDTAFDTLSQTGWNPPDPTLAVGPNHVVVTVNQDIGFYTKSGNLTFFATLNSTGSPGFFEPVGSGTFTFDPKVFYDHYEDRFVVVAPEVYTGSETAWIAIAISDDSDPNGVWFKYRTNAIYSPPGSSDTFWWDYPGFGYDRDAYYVTSNLFGLNNSNFGGAGFRIFRKSDMLSGNPVNFTTLADPGGASVQAAHHYGDNAAAYFISTVGGTLVRLHAIDDPLGSPGLSSTTVNVPGFNSPQTAPSPSGGVNTIGTRMMNAYWRDGKLTATHNARVDSRNTARWYEVDTNSWPDAGSPTLAQAGDVPGPDNTEVFFPAIASNDRGDIALVMGNSSASQNTGIAITGRTAFDMPGEMGAPSTIFVGPSGGSGRWGDYYDLCTDPVDGNTFWYIAQYQRFNGWGTRVGTLSIGPDDAPVALPDEAGIVEFGSPADLDVLENDFHSGGRPFDLTTFDAVSVEGGTVTLLPDAGPNGRDLLRYSPPQGYIGSDSFTYTIEDALGTASAGTVTATALDPDALRAPDGLPASTIAGLSATYYTPYSGSLLPDFDTLTPSFVLDVDQLNFVATPGRFADSGLRDRFAVLFEGFITVDESNLYTFQLTSDAGSRLFIGDTLVVDNDGNRQRAHARGGTDRPAGRSPPHPRRVLRGHRQRRHHREHRPVGRHARAHRRGCARLRRRFLHRRPRLALRAADLRRYLGLPHPLQRPGPRRRLRRTLRPVHLRRHLRLPRQLQRRLPVIARARILACTPRGRRHPAVPLSFHEAHLTRRTPVPSQ